MEIKSYIDPEEMREFLIQKCHEPSTFEQIPDSMFALGKAHGRIEAGTKILGDLIRFLKD
jgi:hypothetical protein